MRMRRALLALSIAVLGAASAACPAFLSDPFRIDREGADATTDEGVSPQGDAGPTSDGMAMDAVPLDGSACCELSTDPLDQASFDHWVPVGAPRAFAAFTELTADTTQQAAGVFWPTEMSFTNFEVKFDFSITKPADSGLPADGIAFVAVTNVVEDCDAGANLCVLGSSSGFGVIIRTYGSAKEPPTPYIAMVDTAGTLHDDAGPPLLGGLYAHLEAGSVVFAAPADAQAPPADSWQTLCVRVAGGLGTVKLAGTTILSDVPVADLPLAHWGLVGATGSASERNAVRLVVMSGACGDAGPCEDAGLCGD